MQAQRETAYYLYTVAEALRLQVHAPHNACEKHQNFSCHQKWGHAMKFNHSMHLLELKLCLMH